MDTSIPVCLTFNYTVRAELANSVTFGDWDSHPPASFNGKSMKQIEDFEHLGKERKVEIQ